MLSQLLTVIQLFLQIKLNDGFPQNICSLCIKTVQYILEFRKKCKEAETELISIKKDNKNSDTSDFDIQTKHNDIQSTTLKDFHKENHNIKVKTENHIEIKIELEADVNDDDDKPLIFLKENPHKSSQIRVTNVLYDINDNSSRITCKLCQKNLSKRSFNMHMARRHPGADDTRMKCELCDDYILKDNLNRHLATIHGTDSFVCRVSY